MNEISVTDQLNPEDQSSKKLFAWDHDYTNNACLNWMHDPSCAYARGYKESAELICNHVINGSGTIDILVYPICALYRHYIELRLKEILSQCYKLYKVKKGVPHHHDIEKLWDETKAYAIKLWPEGDKSELNQVEDLLKEFHSIDPRSQDFRYPKNEKGTYSLKDLQYINIRNLKESMVVVSDLLEGISMGASEAKKFLEQGTTI